MIQYIFRAFFVAISSGLILLNNISLAEDDINNNNQTRHIETTKIDKFQNTVSAGPVKISKASFNRPIRIAVIYPSNDISDFWVRNKIAMERRLIDLNIPIEITEFSSRQIEHSLQTQYTQEVLNAKEAYDFVIYGPSELELQSSNIQDLSASEDFKTFIWAFNTPNKDWKHQPDGWFDFSSSMGANVLCEHVIEQLGSDVYFAANRGMPGITDNQRSQGFIDCVENKADWLNMYEHFGQYQKLGGGDGAKLLIDNFPEVTMIHNANTAMTMGAVGTIKEANKLSEIFITGWGGTAIEIDKIKSGELDATPMRMSDDLGVATAEAIKYHIEDKASEVPLIYLGRIIVAHKGMSHEELNTLTQEAFRYSGIK